MRWLGNLFFTLSLFCLATNLTGCRSMRQANLTNLQKARRAAEIFSYGAPSPVQVKPIRRPRVLNPVTRYFSAAQPPSERTARLLRSYNLLERLDTHPDDVIQWLQELVMHSPKLEEVTALAEIAKLQADWHAANGDAAIALKLDAIALLHAHQFLFDSNLDIKRNAYDPQFRQICDIYNGSLEAIVRRLAIDDAIVDGQEISIGDGELGFDMEIQLEGRWKDQTFERFELVSDFTTEGIDNQFHTYGLGVPLIAVLENQNATHGVEKYYPPSLTLPMTAFCEIQPRRVEQNSSAIGGGVSQRRSAILRLYDPLENTTAQSLNHSVPLESDITTPLAYHLKDPLLNGRVLATATLLNSTLADKIHGLYMLEPFDPNKIPVVMVHGLWSSPVTWAQMFNDLRAVPEIRENYQFWFYSYPSGQPFVISAGQMREDLRDVRRELDPGNDSVALDQMVLVGHSMGGLISRMQVIGSGDDFWHLLGTGPFEQLQGNQQAIQKLRQSVFFEANPAIKRVVTIATPNHGSRTSNATTRWLSEKLISLPAFTVQDFHNLALRNRNIIFAPEVLTGTSVDSLSPTAPIFGALNQIPPQPQTTFNNVIGRIDKRGYSPFATDDDDLGTDGVVSVESAQYEYALTQTIVPSEHSFVHTHPKCILEVRRVLLEHLVAQNRIRERTIPEIPIASRLSAE